ncbi:hypothetical protein [Dyadobacter sp. CY343]|uniref:hypothetical protein n=1 Tax=Dyadobacter sp. CY343 TaxID=2907299 RepID=UPI001F34B911|nr:hypothetical protein [Dyadobacter sp. CY343]MCE7060111.1 hypothetical protein [Dyadobacter sp. CY343]
MKVKLGKNHISYLINNLYQEQESFKNILIQISDEIPSVIFEVDDDSADAIRDWAGEQLQKIGFDINYELNYEGKILEELIDIFYAG